MPDATLVDNTDIAICDIERDSLEVPQVAGQTYYWINTAGVQPDTVFRGIDSSKIVFGNGGFVIDGDFHCVVVGLNGCFTLSDTVNVEVQIVAQEGISVISGSTDICFGSPTPPLIQLNNFSNYDTASIRWFRDSLGVVTPYDTLLTNGQFQIFAQDSGRYFATYETPLGCLGISDSLAITVRALPIVTLDTFGTVSICDGDTFTLSATASGIITYSWFGIAQGAIPNPSPPFDEIDIFVEDGYYVSINDGSCDAVSDTVYLELNPLPWVGVDTIAGTARFCAYPGNSVTLAADSVFPTSIYTWVYNGVDTVFGPTLGSSNMVTDSAGDYSLMIINSNGCTDTSTQVTVIVDTLQQYNITGLDTVCAPEAEVYTADVPGSWSLSNANGSIQPPATGTATVTIDWISPVASVLTFSPDPSGVVLCPVDTDTTIRIFNKPGVTITGPVEICQDSTGIFEASLGVGDSYDWNLTAGSANQPHNFSGVGFLGFRDTIQFSNFGQDTLVVSRIDPNSANCESTDTIVIKTFRNVFAEFSGSTDTCEGSVVVYNVDSLSPWSTVNYNSYVSPNGTIISSGQGTVTVQWGTGPTGWVAFSVTNGPCYDSVYKDVTLTPAPVTGIASSIPGDTICELEFDTISFWSTNPDPTHTYFWDVQQGVTVVSQLGGVTNDTLVLVIQQNGSFTVELQQTNAAGCRTDSLLAIHISEDPGNIVIDDWPVAACADGSTRSYTLSNVKPNTLITPFINDQQPNGPNNITWTGSQLLVNWGLAKQNSYVVLEATLETCTRFDTFFIQVDTLAEVIMLPTNPQSFCANEPVILIATPQDTSYTYQWFRDGDSIQGATDSVYVVDSTGDYSVRVTTLGGCSELSNSAFMTVFGIPNATILGDSIICPGDSTVLSSADNNVISYLWRNLFTQDSFPSSTVTVDEPGLWQLILINGDDCKDTSEVFEVYELQNPGVVILVDTNTYCNNDTVLLTGLFTGDSISILWTTDGLGNLINPDQDTAFYVPSDLDQGAVNFNVEVSNPCLVVEDDTVISFLDAPSARYVTSVPVGEIDQPVQFVLEDKTAFEYFWDFGDATGVGVDPVHVYASAGEFMTGVLAENANGCTDTFFLPFTVTNNEQVYLPNAFSPNSSNAENRTFKVYGYNVQASEFELTIYNRWGTKVYSTTDIGEAKFVGWDGTSTSLGGGNVPQGVYTYYIKGKFRSGESFEKAGTVNLIR